MRSLKVVRQVDGHCDVRDSREWGAIPVEDLDGIPEVGDAHLVDRDPSLVRSGLDVGEVG